MYPYPLARATAGGPTASATVGGLTASASAGGLTASATVGGLAVSASEFYAPMSAAGPHAVDGFPALCTVGRRPAGSRGESSWRPPKAASAVRPLTRRLPALSVGPKFAATPIIR
jgi:hypothetical protein